MKSFLSSDDSEKPATSQVQRRKLLQTAFVVTAGTGIQSLASAEPFESQSSGTESPLGKAIKACLDCHSMCLQTAMNRCLTLGGRHVEQQHFRLMVNCAELCQTSANFMLSGSPLHGQVCAVCAEACEACAKSCEEVGDMRECVEECKRCAESCRSMA